MLVPGAGRLLRQLADSANQRSRHDVTWGCEINLFSLVPWEGLEPS